MRIECLKGFYIIKTDISYVKFEFEIYIYKVHVHAKINDMNDKSKIFIFLTLKFLPMFTS